MSFDTDKKMVFFFYNYVSLVNDKSKAEPEGCFEGQIILQCFSAAGLYLIERFTSCSKIKHSLNSIFMMGNCEQLYKSGDY